MGVVVLVLVESGRGLNLETGVFVGKSLRGAVVFVGDSNLKDRKQKICSRYNYRILSRHESHSCTLQKERQRSTAGQSELLLVLF